MVHQAAPGRGERRVQQRPDRHADVARVADVGVAVGVGQPGGLQVVEQRGHPGLGPQVPQDRMIVGLDDGPAERPVVQVGRAVPGQQPVGPGQVGVAQQVPGRQRVAGRGEEQPAAGRVGPQLGQVGLLELAEVRAHPEAAVRDPDGRLQVCGQAVAAVPPHGLGPGGHHRGHPGGQRLIGGVVVVERLAGLGVGEHRWGARARTGLAAVNGHDLVLLGQVDHHEAAAARTGNERDCHAHRGGRCDRGVDRVAAMGEHIDARLARAQAHGRDRASGAQGDRLLLDASQDPAGGRPRRKRQAQERCGQGRRNRDGHQATMHRYLTTVVGERLACLFPLSAAQRGRFQPGQARRPARTAQTA